LPLGVDDSPAQSHEEQGDGDGRKDSACFHVWINTLVSCTEFRIFDGPHFIKGRVRRGGLG
jgi:hypothetical protein